MSSPRWWLPLLGQAEGRHPCILSQQWLQDNHTHSCKYPQKESDRKLSFYCIPDNLITEELLALSPFHSRFVSEAKRSFKTTLSQAVELTSVPLTTDNDAWKWHKLPSPMKTGEELPSSNYNTQFTKQISPPWNSLQSNTRVMMYLAFSFPQSGYRPRTSLVSALNGHSCLYQE